MATKRQNLRTAALNKIAIVKYKVTIIRIKVAIVLYKDIIMIKLQ